MKLVVYSHDAFGLGNIRRMMAICEHLLTSVPNLSILLISGSPVLHRFRTPTGLDYIKLPCVGRNRTGEVSAKFLGIDAQTAVKLRSNLIQTAVAHFEPDLLLVDKKPYGLHGELTDTLAWLRIHLPDTPCVLLLRDIIDRPVVTIAEWRRLGYVEAIANLYRQVLVLGTPEVFDLSAEYQLPTAAAQKVRFCGYIRKPPGNHSAEAMRHALGVQSDEQLVLVTPGGGEDGDYLIETYLAGLAHLPPEYNKIHSVVICGPEMPYAKRQVLCQAAAANPKVQMLEFTDDLMSYMGAADSVVSMGGYNTTCEILSLVKRAVVVPRVSPVQEQWIRAKRLAELGLLRVIHPDQLTPETLMQALMAQLNPDTGDNANTTFNLNALPRLTQHLLELLPQQNESCVLPPFTPPAPEPPPLITATSACPLRACL